MSAVCPHCRAALSPSATALGPGAACPECGKALAPAEPSLFDDFPAPLLWMCILALFVLLFLIIAAFIGPAKSGGVVAGIALAILLFWKRAAIRRTIRDYRRRAAERRRLRAEEKAREAEALDEDEQRILQGSSPAVPNPMPAVSPPPPPKARPVPPVAYPAVAPAVTPAPKPAPAPVPEPAASQGSDDFTAGLNEPYRPFLLAALNRAEWERSALEDEARRHQVALADALGVIGRWSQEKYQDTILVDEGNLIRIQLPLL